MKLAIVGATGSIGRKATEQALAAGHQVKAISRSGGWSGPKDTGLTIAQADVHDPQALIPLIDGQDAVIITLGGGLFSRTRSIGTRNVIAAMNATGTKRLIAMSTIGVDESRDLLNFYWKRIMFGAILRSVYRDHHVQEAAVRASGLEWTIIRPGAFDDEQPRGGYHFGDLHKLRGKLKLAIARSDVASVLLEAATRGTHLHAAPCISQ